MRIYYKNYRLLEYIKLFTAMQVSDLVNAFPGHQSGSLHLFFFVSLFVCLFVCLSLCSYIYLPICLSVRLSKCLSFSLSVRAFICCFAGLSVCLDSLLFCWSVSCSISFTKQKISELRISL